MKFAEVVVVLLDAAIPFEQQDLRIADLAEREGRAAVVIAVNKWDVEDRKTGQKLARPAKKQSTRLLPQLQRRTADYSVGQNRASGLDRLARDAVHQGTMTSGTAG